METKQTKKIGVIYHYPCFDGTYAALNLYLYLKNFKKNKFELYYHPSNSFNRISEGFSKEFKYDKVYILDKGLDDEDYAYLLSNDLRAKICIIDHHSSSIELFNLNYSERFKTTKNIEIFFEQNNTKSAAGMTYDYFYKKATRKYKEEEVAKIFSEKWKKMIDYIEDSDIGRNVLPYSHQFKSGLAE
jgi:nanoRNase/pAp phosphatase (c-di-AMP/oligoRNAs hydrolase)